MPIYTPVVEHMLILRVMMICMMLKDMDGEDPRGFRNLNIMLLNCTSVVGYSLLFFTQVDYVKNTVLMLGFVLNPIIFNGYRHINQSYGLNATMDCKMQLEQGLRKMHRDWGIKSSS